MANFYNPNVNMYPYQNGYMNYNMQTGMQQYQPQAYQSVFQQPQNNIQTTSIPSLNGKIVDGIDAVKIQDVPIGSFGIYPQADLNRVYVKQWTPQGSTQIIEYSPIIDNKEEKVFNYEDAFNSLKESISNIEAKIDKIQAQKQPRKRVDEYDE